MISPRQKTFILLFLIFTLAFSQSETQDKSQTKTRTQQSEQPPVEQIIQMPKPVIVDPVQVQPIISDQPVLVKDVDAPILVNDNNQKENLQPAESASKPSAPISSNLTETQKSQEVLINLPQTQKQEQQTKESNDRPNIAIKQQKQTARQMEYQEPKPQQVGVHDDRVFENDRKLTRSEQIKFRERSEISSVYNSYDLNQPKKTVLFEINTQIDQFLISPTTDEQIAIKMLLYTLENDAYGFVKDIDVSKALKVFVYQNNDRIVGQGQFYYEKAIKFQAKAGAHYVIRFYNDGVLKLVSFTYPSIIQHSQMSSILKRQKGKYHLEEIHFLDRRLEEVTSRLRRNTLLDKVNNQTVTNLLTNYSGYQFIQMLFVIAITIFQVQMVKKMFRTDSIL